MAERINTFFIGLLASALLLLSPSTGSAGTESITLTDMTGATVTVPKKIKSVVPLGGALRFMVYAKSLDLVAGMERMEQKWTSAGRLYGLATAEAAKKLPVVGEGGPGKLPDFERLIGIWPDVIVTMGLDDGQVATIRKKTGIPVFALSYGAPGVLDVKSARTAISLLGKLLDREERAAQLLSAMDRLDKDLSERTSDIAGAKRQVAYVGAISFKGNQGITSTEAAYAPLAWGGGTNAAAGIDRPGHLFIDPEQLLAWNPPHMFLDAGSLDIVAEDYQKNPGFYQRLSAVQNKKIFLVMPYNYYHTNIEIAYADAFYIGKTLYPKRFADIDPAAKADEIFRLFIGVSGYQPLKKEYHGFGRVDFGEKELVVR